ncbi:hypothetical protein [Aquimarina agarivorans]|uniref:hypothetical protein n=1 Tax=Aquimarina agarivorans TaxID=980584 RepID=UPI000248E692|nr:hypothetical protein [Aquimarina agarivorans]
MELPNIYNFIDEKYSPLLSYLFTLPVNDFLNFLKAIRDRSGLVREYHGFDFEKSNEYVEFWDDSSGQELIIELSISNLLALLSPIIDSFKDDLEINKQITLTINEIKSSL